MMTPEDVPRMMQTMMDSLFKDMRTEDRVDFPQNLMHVHDLLGTGS
ncbi:MAG: hypothetical protein M0Z44_04180 [Gammaproteobacteria bacterium]|nr:hypothetical protein [Gammaproteobacteria bacterium]